MYKTDYKHIYDIIPHRWYYNFEIKKFRCLHFRSCYKKVMVDEILVDVRCRTSGQPLKGDENYFPPFLFLLLAA